MRNSSAHPWTGLAVLAFAVLGAITTEVVPIGLLPQIVTAFGVDEAQAGTLISLYAALVALTAVPLTRWTRRIARKPLILATLTLFAVSNLIAAVAGDFAVLVLARGLGGVAHALFFAVAIGYAARIAPAGQTGRAMALVATGTSAGLILGVPAGTVLADILGWRATFGLLAALIGVALVAAIFLLAPTEHDAAAGRALVPGGSRMLLVAALAALAFLGYYALYSYVSPMLLSVGLPPLWLGAVLAGLGIAGLVGIQLVARRLDSAPVAWMIAVPAAIALSQLALVLIYPAFAPVLVVAALWTAAFGPVNSTYQNVLVRVGRAGPDMAGAWINVLCNVGIGAGTAIGGILVTGLGYQAAGLFGVAVLALSLVVTVAARRILRSAVAD